ncbi:MAG: glycosyltransferase family 4 protein [Desulfobacterales bacterium]|nr:glycosyltransferase family 4 protein [Desulfobacterales bacterium]
MNILIITHYFWPESYRINDLAVSLIQCGHQVTVITNIPNYPDGYFFKGYGIFKKNVEIYNGVRIIRVPLIPRGKQGALRLALSYLSSAFSASGIVLFLVKNRFDLVFVFQPSPVTTGLPAMLMKKLCRIPIFLWVQDVWPETLSATGMVKSKTILKTVEYLVKIIYRGCDRLLIQSEAFEPCLKRLGVPADRIRYFPNSAEALYAPMEIESDAPERSTMPDGFRIMFAGNIGKAQDFPTILTAAERLKKHKDIHWIILGDGSMRAWVEDEIKSRGLEVTVHLLGRHPVTTMPRFFSLADVLLVTLKKEKIFSLTIPSKVQSYLACAKPILAAIDGEGARIIEESGGGMAVPAGDARALAKKVLTMYQLPKTELTKMGKRGEKYFCGHFNRDVLLDKLNIWITEGAAK